MRKAAWAALLAAGFGLPGVARAEIGTIDAVPAATLLLPYFEVNLADTNGVTTLLSINDASATAALVKVTLWTDLGVPTLSFPVYLTGYDVTTINLRDVLNGNLPQTATDGQDLGDTASQSDGISNQGQLSQDINFASCGDSSPPDLPLPPLSPSLAAELRAAHLGQAAATLFGGLCGGVNYGDNIARGFVTADAVNNCTARNPRIAGYFAPGGTGDATDQNILWGDYFYINPGQNFAQGDTLVHVEASAANPETSIAGQYTFYGRFVGWTAADNREPLVTNFAARYLNGGAFTGGTSYIVWRDSKTNQGPFTCPAVLGVRPTWYPLSQEGIVIFDEQEHPLVPIIPPFFPPPPVDPFIPFPAMATRTQVGSAALATPFTFGWMYLNLNTTIAANPNPAEDPAAAQAWLTEVHDSSGRFSVGYSASQLDSATVARHTFPQ